MTVSTTARSQQFSMNGSTADFTFTFRTLYSAPTNIKCVATVGGVDTTLTYTTDYTVSVNSNGVGGTVTLVDPAGVGSGTLTVYRETTNTQVSDYDDYNQFPADTLEEDLDIRTLVSQEQADNQDRTLTLPISTDSGVSSELASPAADTFIGWNSDGTALENKTLASLDALSLATQSEAQAGTNNTAYMTPLRTEQSKKSINLTASPSSDHEASGIKIALDSSLDLAIGNIVYINSNGVLAKADADAIATASAIGIALSTTTIATASDSTILLHGVMRDDSWTLTVGSLVYLSTTAGVIAQDAPSGTDDVIQILGIATHADRLYFNPQLVQVEHT